MYRSVYIKEDRVETIAEIEEVRNRGNEKKSPEQKANKAYEMETDCQY